jgi:hypothetical protein
MILAYTLLYVSLLPRGLVAGGSNSFIFIRKINVGHPVSAALKCTGPENGNLMFSLNAISP